MAVGSIASTVKESPEQSPKQILGQFLTLRGAENLIGSGDMILQTGVESIRLQGAYISSEEIDRLASYVESFVSHYEARGT